MAEVESNGGEEAAVAADGGGGGRDALAGLMLSRFAPDWPGLRLGVECALLEREGEGGADEPSLRLTKFAACVEPQVLRLFAARALAAMGGHPGFPWTERQRMPRVSEVGARSERGSMTLGEEQALAACMWALAPLYELHDEEMLAATAREMSGARAGFGPPVHVVQLPHAPIDGPAEGGWLAGEGVDGEAPGSRGRTGGTGGWFRISYMVMRDDDSGRDDNSGNDSEIVGEGGGHLGRVEAAWGRTLSALAAMGGLPDGASAGSQSHAKGRAAQARMSPGWEFHALGHFNPLWEKCELGMQAGPGVPGGGAKGPRL